MRDSSRAGPAVRPRGSYGPWLGSLAFLVVAPGSVVGLGPWLLTRWHPGSPRIVALAVGWLVLVPCLLMLLHSFGMFAVVGRGTPAPVAPTEHLVVQGAYRYVRNPMYVAVTGAVLAQGAILGRGVVLVYAGVVWTLMAAFVRWHEEPALRRRHGSDYEAYCAAVRAWIPSSPRDVPNAPGRWRAKDRAAGRVRVRLDSDTGGMPYGPPNNYYMNRSNT